MSTFLVPFNLVGNIAGFDVMEQAVGSVLKSLIAPHALHATMNVPVVTSRQDRCWELIARPVDQSISHPFSCFVSYTFVFLQEMAINTDPFNCSIGREFKKKKQTVKFSSLNITLLLRLRGLGGGSGRKIVKAGVVDCIKEAVFLDSTEQLRI